MKSVRWTAIKNLTQEYIAASSCHGMAYIMHPRVSLTERICWSVVVAVSLSVCISAIVVGHQKWIEKPMIVSFSPKPIPVWKIPFPAITICPQTRIDVDKFNITEVYRRARTNQTLSADEWRKLRVLSHVCSSVMRPKNDYYGLGGTEPEVEVDEEVVQQLDSMSIEYSTVLSTCMWSFNFRLCSALWAKKITENGICYSFNMLSSEELYSEDQAFREREINGYLRAAGLHKFHAAHRRSTGWTMENGYTNREDLLAYPMRTASGGFKGGAIVLMKSSNRHREYVCSGALQGYKVTIHPPDEFPRLSEYYIRVPPMQAVSVIVKPRVLTTQRSLHRHPPSKRQCFFADERKLRFFRVYNEQNCEFECLTNYTLESCGCVTFAMPRENTTRVCSQQEKRCYKAAVTRLMELDEVAIYTGQEVCECLPACTTIKYDVELSNDWLNLDAMLDSLIHKESGMEGIEPMILYVYFKDNKFLYTERVEYMNFNGELANFGGILALLSGMSLTSLAEIVYYLTVRPLSLWLQRRYTRVKVGPTVPVYRVRPWIP
ncbi:pickpocket protein 28-like [Anopheles nili]|uniref:pickpocket protein 28-like n=1 Tax=Anopheles nili TaxID=185578 RepID=UPI00237BB4F3|nr:pickpocket protein 28-like [Anopheles nili]